MKDSRILIQCRMDQMDKDMVEQSHTTPYSIWKEYLNHPLGLTLSTPGLVVDKPKAKSQSKAQSPKSPKKVTEVFGLWASH